MDQYSIKPQELSWGFAFGVINWRSSTNNIAYLYDALFGLGVPEDAQ
jgi:hypothetical protein